MPTKESSLKVDETKIKEMYALAYALYKKKRYLDATHLFRLLTASKPLEGKFWKGFGACLQMLQEYEEALDCYACANELNTDRPDPYLYVHAADCCFAQKQIEEGLLLLSAAQECAKKTNDERISTHVALMRQQWKTNVNEKVKS